MEIPFTPVSPYQVRPAVDINSTVEDCARWLRLQRWQQHLRRTATRMAKFSISEAVAYAMGWIVLDTPYGRVVYHNDGTNGFGARIGFLPHKGVGTIILTNQSNEGFPDAVGL